MRHLIIVTVLISPIQAQFLTPAWRGQDNSEHAAWDIFTEAKLEPNSPDVSADFPTLDAELQCNTSSAFLTSSGNIYSFQSATAFQLTDSTNFPVRNVLLQISALGSEIAPDSVKLVGTDASGERKAFSPIRSFVLNQQELTGANGGLGTTYAYQWDLTEIPSVGEYGILFAAAESSMSLGAVSLDSYDQYLEVPIPEPVLPTPSMSISDDTINLSWPARYLLESSTNVSVWTEERGTGEDSGSKTLALPLSSQATFFRLKQATGNE